MKVSSYGSSIKYNKVRVGKYERQAKKLSIALFKWVDELTVRKFRYLQKGVISEGI